MRNFQNLWAADEVGSGPRGASPVVDEYLTQDQTTPAQPDLLALGEGGGGWPEAESPYSDSPAPRNQDDPGGLNRGGFVPSAPSPYVTPDPPPMTWPDQGDPNYPDMPIPGPDGPHVPDPGNTYVPEGGIVPDSMNLPPLAPFRAPAPPPGQSPGFLPGEHIPNLPAPAGGLTSRGDFRLPSAASRRATTRRNSGPGPGLGLSRMAGSGAPYVGSGADFGGSGLDMSSLPPELLQEVLRRIQSE